MKAFIVFMALTALIGCASALCEYGQTEANETYNMTNYTCVQVRATGNEDYSLILCDAATNDCTVYNHSAYLPLDNTKDYIIKVSPQQIQTSGQLVAYFNRFQVWLYLLLIIVIFFTIYGFVKVAL